MIPAHIDAAIGGAGLTVKEQVALTKAAECLCSELLESWKHKDPEFIVEYLRSEVAEGAPHSCVFPACSKLGPCNLLLS